MNPTSQWEEICFKEIRMRMRCAFNETQKAKPALITAFVQGLAALFSKYKI